MKKIIALVMAIILVVCALPVTALAEAQTAVTENTETTPTAEANEEKEYIYYSDLFYGYSSYLTQNSYLPTFEKNTFDVTTNILNEYITTTHFKASAWAESIDIACDPAAIAKYVSDNIGLSNFKFNDELDKANQKFAETLCDVNLKASKEVGAENKYVKNINKFLNIVEEIDKILVEKESQLNGLDEPELYATFMDRAIALLEEYFTELDPQLPSLKSELYTVLSETTKILVNVADTVDFVKALSLSIAMQETQLELINDIIDTQSSSSTLYKGMTRLKNQLSGGFVTYFTSTYIQEKVYDQIIGYLPSLAKDIVFQGWLSYGPAVTSVVSIVNNVVFKGWFGLDYSEYTSAVMLAQYASDLYNGLKEKTTVFSSQFENSEIGKFETFYNAYIKMKSAAFKECKNLAKHNSKEDNSKYNTVYVESVQHYFDEENAYEEYIDGVKAFIKLIPIKERIVTDFGTWEINEITSLKAESDCIDESSVYCVNGSFNANINIKENSDFTICTNVYIPSITTLSQIVAANYNINVCVNSIDFCSALVYGQSAIYYWDKGNLFVEKTLETKGNHSDGKTVIISLNGGNIYLKSDLNINTYSNIQVSHSSELIVSGNITVQSGIGGSIRHGVAYLKVNDGFVQCSNLNLLRGTAGTGGTAPQSVLYLNSNSSQVVVLGDFYIDGITRNLTSRNLYLYAGKLFVSGDMNFSSIYCTYLSDGQLVLDGNDLQSITNANASTIIINNPSSDGIVFTSKISPSVLFDHKGNNFTLYNNGNGSSFVDYDGDGLKDNVDPHPTTHENCVDGHSYSDWQIGEAPLPGVAGYKYIECYGCGDTITEELPAVEVLKFSGASLTLHNNLTVNYKVSKMLFEEAGYENPYVLFEISGEKRIVKSYTVDGDYYIFKLTSIAPNQMNDTIYATLYAKYDGVLYNSETKEYSIAEYCYNMLANYSGDEYASLRTLIVDLLHYGADSQIYTGHNTENLVNAALTYEQKAWGTAGTPELNFVLNTKYETVKNPTAQWKGAGLVLNNSITLRFMFTANNAYDLTAKISTDSDSWVKASNSFKYENGVYYVYFSGLHAAQMSENIYLTLYDGDTPVSDTVLYSIESYAYSKQNGTDEKLAALVNSMMKYGNAAYAYAN